MNRSAIALAADSAVTLSGGSSVAKIFQNENKLFELSRRFPVAVMLYNSMGLFQIPWEVIIKDFRYDVGDEPADHIFGWAEKFRSYVVEHAIFHPSPERQNEFIKSLLKTEFQKVLQLWTDEAKSYQPARALTLQGFPAASGCDSMLVEVDSHRRGTDGHGSDDHADGALGSGVAGDGWQMR